MSDVSQWVADLETHFQSVEDTAKAFLQAHIPGLASLAQKIESSPLLAAAEAIAGAVDPAAEQVLADALSRLATLAPAAQVPAPAEPVAEAPAEVQVPG